MKYLTTTLLWLAVLPGALLAGVISIFVLHWILYATLSNFVTPYPHLPERLLTPLVFNLALIRAGAFIAPKYKLPTAVLIFSVTIFFLGGVIFAVWTNSSFFGKQLELYGGGFAPVFGIVGAFIALYQSYRTYKNDDTAVESLPQDYAESTVINEETAMIPPTREVVVMHVSKYQFYLQVVKKTITEKEPQIKFIHFTDSTVALEYIKNIGHSNPVVDCIITDLNFPRMQGDEFAKEVRGLNTSFAKNVPIILLSIFCDSKELVNVLKQWQEQQLFNRCLGINANSDQIKEAILELVDPPGNV